MADNEQDHESEHGCVRFGQPFAITEPGEYVIEKADGKSPLVVKPYKRLRRVIPLAFPKPVTVN